MQNLDIHSVSHLRFALPSSSLSALTVFEAPSGLRQLYLAVPSADHTLCLHAVSLPPSSSIVTETPISTALSSNPKSVCILGESLLIVTRDGELFTFDTLNGLVHPVGEVVDEENPACSGVLDAVSSPDGNLVVVVSPVKTLVLDATLDVRAEIPHAEVPAINARVSWRGDGEFFVVALEGKNHQLRGVVVDRECATVKTLDTDSIADIKGGHLAVAWEPRIGGFICLSIGDGRLIFFERNGLRHLRSDFDLHFVAPPLLLSWSADSRILAVVQKFDAKKTTVSLFMRTNYKWYCKRVVQVGDEVLMVHWDEDVVDSMALFTKEGFALFTRFQVLPGTVFDVMGGAHAFVIDGINVCVTNLTRAVLPPPMNHGVVKYDDAVQEICSWEADSQTGALLANGAFQVVEIKDCFHRAQADCSTQANGAKICENQKWQFGIGSEATPFLTTRSPVFVARDAVVVVNHASPWSEDNVEPQELLQLFCLGTDGSELKLLDEYEVDGCVRVLSRSVTNSEIIMATSKGCIVRLKVDRKSGTFEEVASAPHAVSSGAVRIRDFTVSRERCITLVQDENGTLKAFELTAEKSLYISRECTSFCLQEKFLSFTTTSHLLYCVLLDKASSKSYDVDRNEIPSVCDALDSKIGAVVQDSQGSQLPAGKGATRPIDRSSLIVAAIPGEVAVILQAPRGNLECICPRPVVFETVDEFAKSAKYSEAFSLCRKQRVDMNHVVNANYNLFLENIRKFVDEVEKASHLSIFLTFLRGDVSKINTVCDAVVRTLRDKDNKGRYLNAILTGLIRREPSDFASALDQVREARDRDEEEGAAAVDYLFVLIKNEEKVYREALGTYDLQLALFVARSSQIDPADYSQELKQLSVLDTEKMKYAVDMRLERYDKALRSLYRCGESKFDQCVSLCHEHALYETGLDLFRRDDSYRRNLMDGYGKHLVETDRFEDAGSVFIRNQDWLQASTSFRKGGLWKRSVSAVWRCEQLSVEEKHDLLETLVDELVDNGKLKEAAHVRLLHLDDIDGAIELLSRDEEWEEMFESIAVHCARQASKESSADAEEKMLWQKVAGMILEGADVLLSTLRENGGKLRERRKRLEIVREAKREISARMAANGGPMGEADSDAFSASTASSLVSNLSDVTFTSRTSATSVFTTISGTGPMSVAKLAKQAEKRRRKAARKRIREGHPREEEYLVGYLKKLVPGTFLRQRVRKMGVALMFIGKVDEVKTLLKEMTVYVDETKLLPEDVLDSEELREATTDKAWLEPGKVVELL